MNRKIWGVLAALVLVFGFSGLAHAANEIIQVDTVYVSVDDSTDSTTTPITGPTIKFDTGGLAQGDSLRFQVKTDSVNFLAPDSVVVSSARGTRLIDAADSTHINYAFPDPANGYVKFYVDSLGTLPDTLTFSGLKVFPIKTSVMWDSSSVTTLKVKRNGNLIDGGVGARIVLLPGEPTQLVFVAPVTCDTLDAGEVMETATVEVRDQFDNRTAASPPSVKVAPYLKGSTIAGNGTLGGTTTKTATNGQAVFDNLTYTKAEKIELWATASGLSTGKQSELGTWYDVRAGDPKHITLSSSKSTLSVLETTTLTATMTDQFYNPVDDSEKVVFKEKTVVGGSFSAASGYAEETEGDTVQTLVDNGTAKIKYTPSHYYTGGVTLTAYYYGDADVAKDIDLTITPGDVGNVSLTPATKEMVVGSTATFTAELVDAFGNHVDASSTDDVSFSASAGTVGSKSLTADKKVAVEYTARTKSGEQDTLNVQTSAALGGYTDYSVITTKSGPPATMKFIAEDSTVVASDSTLTEALVDSVWDEYGNLSDGYWVKFAVTSGVGIMSADSVKSVAGKVDVNYISGPVAQTETVTASYGSLTASLDIVVKPAATSKLVVPDTIFTQAGQPVTIEAVQYDEFDNHVTETDSSKVAFTKISGKGTLAADTERKVNAAGNVTIEYTAYAVTADTALIQAVYSGVTPDTTVVINTPPGVLDHFEIAFDDTSVSVVDSIKVTITAKDPNDIRIWTYTGAGETITLNGSAATAAQFSWHPEPGWAGAEIEDQGLNAYLPDSAFVDGQVVFYMLNQKAEGPLTFTIADTALGVSSTSGNFYFTPDYVAALVVTAPDTVYTGTAFNFTVTPKDQYGNVNTTQTVYIQVSGNYPDELTVWPADRKIKGPATFSATANAARTDLKLAAYEASTHDYYGESSAITVLTPEAPPALAISSVTASADTVTVGEPFTVTVTLSDTTWAGKVNLSANKASVTLPGFVLATDGVATAEVVANEAMSGLKILAEADGATGCSAEITVEAAPVPVVDAPDTLIVTDAPEPDHGGWVLLKFDQSETDLTNGGIGSGGYYVYRYIGGEIQPWASITYDPTLGDTVRVTLPTVPYMADSLWAVRAVMAPVYQSSEMATAAWASASIAERFYSNAVYGTGVAVSNYPPAEPKQLRAVDNPGDTGGAIALSWEPSADDVLIARGTAHGRAYEIYGVTGYEIYRDGELIATVDRGVTTYVDDTAEDNVSYTYVVKAVDGTFAVPSEANVAIAVDNTLLADFSSNLKVWTEDFAMFVRNFGLGEADVEFDPVFDLDGNGKVWTEDFTIFVGQFGQTAGAAKAIASAEGLNTGASAALDISRDGAAITVDVSAEGLTELASYGLKVSFDPEAVQFLGASGGNLLGNNSLFVAIPTKAGEVWVLNGQPEAVSASSGLLSQLHFKALNEQAVGSAIRVDALDLFDGDARLNSIAAQGLEVTVAPEKFALLQNYPNPGNPSTVISYSLAENSEVNLTIYNTLGQAVRTLVDGHQTANIYKVVWDGRDDSGKEVASGVYFYRLVAGKFSATKRLIVLK